MNGSKTADGLMYLFPTGCSRWRSYVVTLDLVEGCFETALAPPWGHAPHQAGRLEPLRLLLSGRYIAGVSSVISIALRRNGGNGIMSHEREDDTALCSNRR